MITAMVEERTLTTREAMNEAVIAAAAAKNQLVRRSGHSPAQCVLGTDVKLPGDVLDNIDKLPIHDQAMEDGPFKRALDMRETSRIAYVRLQNSDALRRALTARTRPPRTFKAGDQIYFWRRGRLMKGRTRPEPSRWSGPATVIVTEGTSRVWCSYRSRILLVCPEQCRAAGEEEKQANEAMLEALQRHQWDMEHDREQTRFTDARENIPEGDADATIFDLDVLMQGWRTQDGNGERSTGPRLDGDLQEPEEPPPLVNTPPAVAGPMMDAAMATDNESAAV